jgi:hypothetical protein
MMPHRRAPFGRPCEDINKISYLTQSHAELVSAPHHARHTRLVPIWHGGMSRGVLK